MNNTTYSQELAECIASGQVSAEQIEAHVCAGDLVKAAQPKQPQGMTCKDAAYFYNLAMHALSDVGAAHGGCKHRLVHICEELETLMIKNAAQPKETK